MIAATTERFGRLDVLCNNAGIDGKTVPAGEMPSEAFDEVISINLRGVFLGQRHGIPAMLAGGGGSIINTSSIAAISASPGGVAYCAAKAGVLGLTRVAAIEYAQAGVRVNAICPGVIETPMVEALGMDHPSLVGAIAATPAGRLGQPQEVAALTVFLASDESSYITGATLPVDGGFTAT
jgi:NAD(P)-dependent dehydrogenase (short-subunit alcohol dehydrogenase family)